MALEDYSDVATALGNAHEAKLYHQFNRAAETLSIVSAEPAVNKVPSWDAEFSSATAASAYAEGSDIDEAELTTDTLVPATLGWGLYRTGFKLSQTEIQAARASRGSPDELYQILGDRLMTAGARLASLANTDFFTGDGTNGSGNPTIVGLHGGALDATGTYAGILRSTYSEWAGNVLSNGGNARALTPDLLAQAEELIYRATNRKFDFLVGSTGVRRKYRGIFESVIRTDLQGANGPLNLGASDHFYDGQPVRRDKDAPSGKLVMGIADLMKIRYLLPLGMDADTAMSRMAMLQGSNGKPAERVTATSIPYQITPLAKTGNNVKFMLDLSLQLMVFRPNAFVIIQDIAE
jgi:hypothetical protein